jgi:hypothetical protein
MRREYQAQGLGMILYQFKFVRDEETISSANHYFKDDLDALDKATKVAAESDVQIWQGGVQIARVKKGNAALNARDRSGN